MLKQITAKLRDSFRRDPWLVAKFIAATVFLGVLGKAMMIASVQTADLKPIEAQFVPTIPMLGPTFLAHKYIWDHRDASFWSHIGSHWSKVYGAQFVAGHALFTYLALQYGGQYVAVSVAIGFASAIITFVFNEWKIFAERNKRTTPATA